METQDEPPHLALPDPFVTPPGQVPLVAQPQTEAGGCWAQPAASPLQCPAGCPSPAVGAPRLHPLSLSATQGGSVCLSVRLSPSPHSPHPQLNYILNSNLLPFDLQGVFIAPLQVTTSDKRIGQVLLAMGREGLYLSLSLSSLLSLLHI